MVRVEAADDVFDLLVRDHPAHEQHVGPLVVELLRDQPVRRIVEVRQIRNDRQHRRPLEAERLEILRG